MNAIVAFSGTQLRGPFPQSQNAANRLPERAHSYARLLLPAGKRKIRNRINSTVYHRALGEDEVVGVEAQKSPARGEGDRCDLHRRAGTRPVGIEEQAARTRPAVVEDELRPGDGRGAAGVTNKTRRDVSGIDAAEVIGDDFDIVEAGGEIGDLVIAARGVEEYERIVSLPRRSACRRRPGRTGNRRHRRP